MADTGFLSSTVETQFPFAPSVPWSNLSNCHASDNTYATAAVATGQGTWRADFKGFGTGIPTNAIIDGIEALIEKKASGGRNSDLLVRLLKAGGGAGDDKSAAGFWPFVDTQFTYGGAADLWGTTWTPAEINDSGFGIAFRGRNETVGPATLSLDYVALKIYYHIPLGEYIVKARRMGRR